MSEKLYHLKCRRCGRMFTSRQKNTLYCDYPSPHPEDKGRTCKEMRRVESKQKGKMERDKLQREIAAGEIVSTRAFGYITRVDYMSLFDKYLKKKYHLDDYSTFQKWKAENIESFCKEYEAFQQETGLEINDNEINDAMKGEA